MQFDPRKTVEEQRAKQREAAEHLEAMMKTQGWAIFEAYIKAEEEQALASMHTVKDGETALAVTVCLTTMRRLRSYPSSQVAMVVQLEKSP